MLSRKREGSGGGNKAVYLGECVLKNIINTEFLFIKQTYFWTKRVIYIELTGWRTCLRDLKTTASAQWKNKNIVI